jgi:CubicO group peptidase (beta-lactamase class C family)
VSDVWVSIVAVVSIPGVVLGALTVLGMIRMKLHRRPAATGDPELAAALDRVVGKRARRVAAVVIDLDGPQVRRMAFVDGDAETRFEIGSITKGLTGMLAADAVSRGEITMDSPLAALSPRYTRTTLETVTVEQLCTHTSGLPSMPGGPRMVLRSLLGGCFGINPYRGIGAARVARDAGRQRLRHRGRYRYSNLGAAVLGNAVAEHAGLDYSDALSDRILIPLGMVNTSADARRSNVARGWTRAGRRSSPWAMSGYAPAGGLTSTATDMSALAEALLDGGTAGSGALHPVPGHLIGDGPSRQAMFWVVNTLDHSKGTKVWHNGQTGGYSAFIAVYPKAHRAVVVMADLARAVEQQRVADQLIRWAAQEATEDGSS